ncbi:MAG: MalY/PatB family protein [Oscillospiraceae bacterium]
MKYDFTTLLDRSQSGSSKWKGMLEKKNDVPPEIPPFSVADMEFKNAPEIIQAMQHYLNDNILGYTDPTAPYFEAICAWMRDIHHWEIAPEDIVLSPGVVPALYYCVRIFTKTQDNVIIMPPVYGPFFNAPKYSNRDVVLCPLLEKNLSYTIDFPLLKELCAREENKMLIFCNPHNPVGRVWTKDELYRVAKICAENGVLLISDEIHGDIAMPPYQHYSMGRITEFVENLIVCTAPSKTFNLAAMQTSNIIIMNPALRKLFVEFKEENCVESFNALGFAACTAAYNQGREWREEMISVVYENYRYIVDFLAKELPILRTSEMMGTYLVWLDCRELKLSPEELDSLLVKHNLFLSGGTAFGTHGTGFLRMDIACPKKCVVEAMDRLAQAIASIH